MCYAAALKQSSYKRNHLIGLFRFRHFKVSTRREFCLLQRCDNGVGLPELTQAESWMLQEPGTVPRARRPYPVTVPLVCAGTHPRSVPVAGPQCTIFELQNNYCARSTWHRETFYQVQPNASRSHRQRTKMPLTSRRWDSGTSSSFRCCENKKLPMKIHSLRNLILDTITTLITTNAKAGQAGLWPIKWANLPHL